MSGLRSYLLGSVSGSAMLALLPLIGPRHVRRFLAEIAAVAAFMAPAGSAAERGAAANAVFAEGEA